MGCFCCFSSNENNVDRRRNGSRRSAQPPAYPPRNDHNNIAPQPENCKPRPPPESNDNKDARDHKEAANGSSNVIAAQTFTFRELAMATKNFRRECLIGEGGFGRVYKGKLDKGGQVVAVKQLDRNDLTPDQKPLDWFSRMKIALGAAKGLEYLHDKANPPVIYRDLKSSNILLDKFFNAKLSDFGLAKLGPVGEKLHVSSRVMGTYGYCAPEYQRTGQLTVKSDVYSFGVVFLELITGKRVIDTTRQNNEQNLVAWAQPVFKEPSRYPELADPLLQGDFPVRGLNQAVAVAAMCLQEEPLVRPLISDVVSALGLLGDGLEEGAEPAASFPSPPTMETLDSAKERQLAVDEAIEWGSNSRRMASQSPRATAS
ncbi:hypothetical protein Peur_048918 [Populus x canadensis]